MSDSPEARLPEPGNEDTAQPPTPDNIPSSYFPNASQITIHGGHIGHVYNSYTNIAQAAGRFHPPRPIPDWLTIYTKYGSEFNMGYPLWNPGPDTCGTSLNYQRNGMRIGDLGIIQAQGKFRYMFNLSLPPNHEDNISRLPPGLPRFLLSDGDGWDDGSTGVSHVSNIPFDNRIQYIPQEGVCYMEFVGPSASEEGVLLAFPDGLTGQEMFSGTKMAMMTWSSTHAAQLYRAALRDYPNIENGDIRIITGFKKCSFWGRATFTHDIYATATSERFELTYTSYDEPRRGLRGDWAKTGHALWSDHSVGPHENELRSFPGEVIRNQTMFCRTITPSITDTEFSQIQKETRELKQALYDAENSQSVAANARSTSKSAKKFGLGSFGEWRRTGKKSDGVDVYRHGELNADSELEGVGYSNMDDSDIQASDEGLGEESVLFKGVTNHPCTLLNKELLKQCPNAKVAVTSDDDWMRALPEDRSIKLSVQDLVARVLEIHDIVVRNDGVFVQPKSSEAPAQMDTEQVNHQLKSPAVKKHLGVPALGSPLVRANSH